MDTNEKRQALKDAYPGFTIWAGKVDQMRDTQVSALYFKFKKEGRLRK